MAKARMVEGMGMVEGRVGRRHSLPTEIPRIIESSAGIQNMKDR